MNPALQAVGHTYRGFRVTKYLPIEELQSTLIELIHEPTGAKVMHIANSDVENLFCLSLQTLPTSSNGVAHILEHTVLCGSTKFPVKDPFFSMTRRSLNTFMNAFTGQDFTCYPASSQVKADFYNLLEVYIDAVFHPELKQLSFLQEGHRLEWGPSGALQFQGVVFNEMKGAMSSSESRLWQAISKHLLPDLPYAYNSGGDPKEIPHLTYPELIDFHKSFYHPSRCLFFFYGNLPLASHLDFLETHALTGVEKRGPLPPLPLQKRFKSPIEATDTYPIAATETGEEKTQVAFSWLTAPLSHQSEVLTLSLLEILWFETDASPLKKALLKSKLCKEVDSSIDIEMSEVPFVIVCKGCRKDAAPALRATLWKALDAFLSKPLDPELVEGALHQLEFDRLEIGGEGGPFGLALFMRAGLIKQHGNEPEEGLQVHTLFKELRDRLQDPSYLPSLIQKYFLQNPHLVTLTLLADPELDSREKREEEERLVQITKRLSSEEKEKIRAESEALRKYQESVEHQSIDCLPKISLQEVPPKARDFSLESRSFDALDVYHHATFTNEILYADLLFELPSIPEEDLSMLSLLIKLWTDLGAKGQSYEETLLFTQAHTGGIDAHLALHVSAKDPDHLRPAFSIRGKALQRKKEPFFKLLASYAQGPNLEEKDRIEEWLLQHATELENRLVKNSLNYAIQTALSPFSSASKIYNQWNGLPYYQFVKKLAASKNKDWMERLAPLAEALVSNGKPHLILSCDAKQMKELEAHHFYELGKRKSEGNAKPWHNTPLEKRNLSTTPEAFLISSPVAFTAMGTRTSAYRDAGVAELMLSTELLENVFLHKEVREKGGAYGSGASYMPTTGNYHFYAYRDPHLKRTLEAFRKGIDTIGSGAFTEKDLEEAKLGLIAAMDTPVPPGGRAIVAYAWLRAERTYEERQQLREQILNATCAQVAAAVKQHLAPALFRTVSCLGSERLQKEGAEWARLI
jgi:Zn-dependent M16 (insulinase) family peptidase